MKNLINCKPTALTIRVYKYNHAVFRIKFESDDKKNCYYRNFDNKSYAEICDTFDLLYKLFDKDYIDYYKMEFDRIVRPNNNN